MRWCLSTPGSAEYILPITLSTSVTPVSPYNRRRSLEMYLIERVWDALGDGDRMNSEMHFEAGIERVGDALGGRGRVNSEDALGGHDRSSLEMHSEAVTERVWRCTCRLWSSEIGGVLGGGRFGGRRDGSWDSIHWLTCNCGNVESWVQHPPRDEKLAGSGRLSILGWCCTWFMLYSVWTHDYGMER